MKNLMEIKKFQRTRVTSVDYQIPMQIFEFLVMQHQHPRDLFLIHIHSFFSKYANYDRASCTILEAGR